MCIEFVKILHAHPVIWSVSRLQNAFSGLQTTVYRNSQSLSCHNIPVAMLQKSYRTVNCYCLGMCVVHLFQVFFPNLLIMGSQYSIWRDGLVARTFLAACKKHVCNLKSSWHVSWQEFLIEISTLMRTCTLKFLCWLWISTL